MKIKQKRQVNLPQLIEWAWENGITGDFVSSNQEDITVEIENGLVATDYGSCCPNSKTRFEIEEEEIEIDKNTKLEKIVLVYLDEKNYFITNTFRNVSVLDVEEVVGRPGSQLKTIHYLHDDGTMTLIWKDGKMVE